MTVDDELRRFQYRITEGPMPPEFHLGTVDVLPDGDGSLVIHSTEVVPDDAKPVFDDASPAASTASRRTCRVEQSPFAAQGRAARAGRPPVSMNSWAAAWRTATDQVG